MLDWRDFALCRDLPAEVFFPDSESSPTEAKRICYQCPVRRSCLTEAMIRPEVYGVWGGLSARERRRLRKRRRIVVMEAAAS